MTRVRWIILLALGALLFLAAAPGVVVAEEAPNVTAYLGDDNLNVGDEYPVELIIMNDGSSVDGDGTITNVTVHLDDDPFGVSPSVTPVGSIPDGQIVTITPELTIPADVSPGEYTISGWVNLTYIDGGTPTQNSTAFEVIATVPDEPRFQLETVSGDLERGESGEITLELSNVGAATAHDLRTTFRGEGGLSIGDGTATESTGDLEPGETVLITIDAAVADFAGGGAKPIVADMQYTDEDEIERTEENVRTTLTPRLSADIAISNISSSLAVGQDGELTGVITNEGPGDLRDAVVELAPGSDSVQPAEIRLPIGDLAVNESAAFRTNVEIASGSDAGIRDIEATIAYRGSDGAFLASDPTSLYVSVDPEQTFAIANIQDTLAVGYDGDITGEIVNEGPGTVTDAVLIVEIMSDSLFVEDTRYALPDLDPGEIADFRYPIDVSGSADAGPRQVRFTVEYGGASGKTLTSDTLSNRVHVDPRADEFSLNGIDATFFRGEANELVIEITNERPEPLRNIDARLYADSPISVTADRAFLAELQPNESSRISFEIAPDADARYTTYPVDLDFEYTTERGQTELSEVYYLPIEVVENPDADDGGILRSPAFLISIFILGMGAIGAVAWWRRQ